MTIPIPWPRSLAAFAWLVTKRRSVTMPRGLWIWQETERFDLIFSDVVMPGKNGLALLEELKTAGVATPVVMMSGQANIEMAVRATRIGRGGFSREAGID